MGEPVDLRGRRIAVVGGDEREAEIARLAALTGAAVRAYGFPCPAKGIEGVESSGSAEHALDGADYALFPIPGIDDRGALFAPSAPAPIVPAEGLLRHMNRGGMVILGRADVGLRAAAKHCGLRISEYEDDTELMLLRGPAIVEGVLAQAIGSTDVTIHAATVGVVGHGNVGRLLTRTLVLLGATVHLFARNPAQRADAYTVGAHPHPLTELISLAPELAMLFSTVPVRLVDRETIAALPEDALVVDVAAPPGGVDLEAARSLGRRALWARGMGRRAPVTVGASQWSGIVRRVEAAEEP